MISKPTRYKNVYFYGLSPFYLKAWPKFFSKELPKYFRGYKKVTLISAMFVGAFYLAKWADNAYLKSNLVVEI